jgi:hypothetical protein
MNKNNVRHWRTRKNPFEIIWPEIEDMLTIMPELQASTLFEFFQGKHPASYSAGQRRTLERHVSKWKALNGPDKEVFFAQVKVPGEMMQLDWMCCNKLNITINGEAFDHLLCHCILPYSSWEWASLCFSESLLSLRLTLQSALLELDRCPQVLQIDNCSAATRRISSTVQERKFTDAFLSVVKHFGISPRKIKIATPNENGSIEVSHGHLRRRLQQALLLRGSSNFSSQQEYECFVKKQFSRANKLRQKRFLEDCAAMPVLKASPLTEFEEQTHRVGKGATVNIHKRVYSLPSRLVGKQLSCRIYVERIELYQEAHQVHSMARIYNGHAVKWRDLVHSMADKPGALAQYRYRDAFFPSVNFVNLCERLKADLGDWKGQVEYLQILSQSRDVEDEKLETLLKGLLTEAEPLSLESFRRAMGFERPQVELQAFVPDLSLYNNLYRELSYG